MAGKEQTEHISVERYALDGERPIPSLDVPTHKLKTLTCFFPPPSEVREARQLLVLDSTTNDGKLLIVTLQQALDFSPPKLGWLARVGKRKNYVGVRLHRSRRLVVILLFLLLCGMYTHRHWNVGARNVHASYGATPKLRLARVAKIRRKQQTS